jgi:hypothetical protein
VLLTRNSSSADWSRFSVNPRGYAGDPIKAASGIADMADSIVGSIGRFQWDIAVTRIGQLASEMRLSTGGQSIGGSNGNADELTNWNGTKKRGWGR